MVQDTAAPAMVGAVCCLRATRSMRRKIRRNSVYHMDKSCDILYLQCGKSRQWCLVHIGAVVKHP